MNFFEKYIEYAKDNPKGYWFKSKIWGWGWTPVTWQGWLVVVLAIALIMWRSAMFETAHTNPTDGETFRFVFEIAAIIALLIVVSWRTGEPPKWMWGFPKDQKQDTHNK